MFFNHLISSSILPKYEKSPTCKWSTPLKLFESSAATWSRKLHKLTQSDGVSHAAGPLSQGQWQRQTALWGHSSQAPIQALAQ